MGSIPNVKPHTPSLIFPSLLVVSAMGMLLLFLSTINWGMGVGPDGVVYLGAAQSFLDGQGLIKPYLPPVFLTQFPPLYSLTLAMFGLVEIPLLFGARILNVFLFGHLIFLTGWMIEKSLGRTTWLSVAGAFLSLVSFDLINIHSMVWTESLFLLLAFWGLIFLSFSWQEKRRRYVIGSAVLMGLAILTRYVGVTLVMAGTIGIFLFSQRSMREKTMDAFLFGLISCAPLGLWLLRNFWLSDSTTGRQLDIHVVNFSYITEGMDRLTAMIFPGVRFFWVFLVLMGCLLLFVYLRKGKNILRFFQAEKFPSLLGIFVLVFLSFLVAHNCLFDSRIVFVQRVLTPVLVSLWVLLFWGVGRFLEYTKGDTKWQILLLSFFILICTVHIRKAREILLENTRTGHYYTSQNWQDSVLIERIRRIPEESKIFSNGPDPIYLLTGKRTFRIPRKIDPIVDKEDERFSKALASIRNDSRTEKIYVVWFNNITWRHYLPSEKELRGGLPLVSLDSFGDGTLYRVSEVPFLEKGM